MATRERSGSARSAHLSLGRIDMPAYIPPDPAEVERIRREDDELLASLLVHMAAVQQRLSVDNEFRRWLATGCHLMRANGITPPRPQLVEAAS
jgi:hypothetical protein